MCAQVLPLARVPPARQLRRVCGGGGRPGQADVVRGARQQEPERGSEAPALPDCGEVYLITDVCSIFRFKI